MKTWPRKLFFPAGHKISGRLYLGKHSPKKGKQIVAPRWPKYAKPKSGFGQLPSLTVTFPRIKDSRVWANVSLVMSFTTAITSDDIMVHRNSVSSETPCCDTHKMLGVTPHKI